MIAMDSLVIRTATAADAEALQRLAALDSQGLTAGPHLLAELDGQAVAALSRTDGSVVADPFSRTDTIVALLRRRAEQLTGVRERPGFRRVQPRFHLG
jgi:arginine/ornithine N-succinyltransferase beta subunit